MQFGNSDNLHHQPQEISWRPSGVAYFFSHRFNKLFRSPLTFVLLVWGLLFMILSVTLAYAQDASYPVNQRGTVVNSRAANHRASRNKTEIVEIFSAGEDLVVPPQATASDIAQRRRAAVAPRRARRRQAHD